MANADKVIVETNAARNSLESYALEQRLRMVDQLKDFVEQSVCDTFCDTCRNTEDWLYNEGEDAQKSEYVQRLADLKRIGDAAEKRFLEFENRPQWIAGLRKEITNWESLALSTDEKYSHIPEEERAKVKGECSKLNAWLSAQIAHLETLPKHANPNFTCDQLTQKARELSNFCAPIMNKKKPPPPKEEKKEEPKKDAKADQKDAKADQKDAKADKKAADAAPTGGEKKAEAGMDTAD